MSTTRLHLAPKLVMLGDVTSPPPTSTPHNLHLFHVS